MKYLHIGIENTSNIGDEAITFCIRENLKNYGVEFLTHSFNFCDSGTKFSSSFKTAPVYSFLKRTRFIKALYDLFFIPLKNYKSILAFLTKVKKVDCVLIGGGNLLMGLDLVFPIQIFIYTVLSRLLGKKVQIIFVGYGPFNNKLSKALIDRSIKLSHKVIFRDSLTFKQSKEFNNSEIICDPVLFLSDLKLKDTIEVKPTYDIGISVLAYLDPKIFPEGSEHNYQLFINNFVDFVNQLSINKSVLLFTTDEKADGSTLATIYSKIDQSNVDFRLPKTINELIEVTQSCRLITSTRMHSAIFSLSYNVPVVALSWQKKVSALIQDLGLATYLFDINEINSEQVITTIRELLNNEHANKEYLKILQQSKCLKKDTYDKFFLNLNNYSNTIS
ncbi:polysaccharide pyruvyl transferase family protein [Daejeonella oryzae]|uniref:polysaccharide pyruvyl transferase family protein n=1 Tax=Daejeonella oryzae TaxID=1122943 RepID=UPI0004199259|nr:polysaccharide pyruvyl transferase family protein [Daejeonella oryzae]